MMLNCIRNTFAVATFIVATIIGSPAGAVVGGQLDDFEDGTTMGWREGVATPNPPTNIATNGPGGIDDNYLQNASSGGFGPGSRMVMFNTAQWTGDYLAAGITEIRAHVKNDGPESQLNLRILFQAATQFGDVGYVSMTSIVVPNDGVWYAVSFPITPTDLVSVGLNSFTYEQTMSDVGLVRIMSSATPNFRGDAIVATMGIDNIEAVLPSLPPAADVTAFTDVSGDGIGDFASFIDDGLGGTPEIKVHSGANGNTVSTISFFNVAWTGGAIEAAADGNSDGVANDPAVAFLGFNPATSATIVQVRMAMTGAFVRNIQFFNPAWTKPLDVIVIDDVDGDGNTNDAAIGVLALNEATKAIAVQVKRLSDGSTISTRFFLNPAWSPRAAAAIVRSGQTPLIGVLAVNPVTGSTVVQSRQLSDGAVQANTFFFNVAWRGKDVAVETDLNSDGVANDPAWMVLATNDSTSNSAVQVRNVSGGATVKTIFFLNPAWEGNRVTGSGDISGNLINEVAGMARNRTNDNVVIQVRDYGTTAVIRNIFP